MATAATPADDSDLAEYWADLRPAPPQVRLSGNNLPSLQEMAVAQTVQDMQAWAQKSPHLIRNETFVAELVNRTITTHQDHLTRNAKRYDITGLIEVILSVQNLSAIELKGFVRALPRSLLERIVQADLGATAGGIHALLSLEVLFREGRESDYQLTALPSGGIQVSLRPRSRPGEILQFRLDETFSLSPTPESVPSTSAEPPEDAPFDP